MIIYHPGSKTFIDSSECYFIEPKDPLPEDEDAFVLLQSVLEGEAPGAYWSCDHVLDGFFLSGQLAKEFPHDKP